jgi:hypothetical protein
MTTYIPVVSDVQAPLHDPRAVSAVCTLLADRDLDSVSVGDLSDSTQIGQWVRGKAGEHDGNLAKHRDIAVRLMLDLRIKHLSRSNHDQRLEKYIQAHAGGLSGLPELRTEAFLRLNENGVTYHRKPYRVASGWLLMHGDEGSLSQSPGITALNLAKRCSRSVVCGHTHRMGLSHAHGTHSGLVVSHLWGLEVGHLMDMRRATYLKGGMGHWQPGIGMLIIDGKDVIPMPLPYINGKIYFDGKVYRG